MHVCCCNVVVPSIVASTPPTSPDTVNEYGSEESAEYVIEHEPTLAATQMPYFKFAICREPSTPIAFGIEFGDDP